VTKCKVSHRKKKARGKQSKVIWAMRLQKKGEGKIHKETMTKKAHVPKKEEAGKKRRLKTQILELIPEAERRLVAA